MSDMFQIKALHAESMLSDIVSGIGTIKLNEELIKEAEASGGLIYPISHLKDLVISKRHVDEFVVEQNKKKQKGRKEEPKKSTANDTVTRDELFTTEEAIDHDCNSHFITIIETLEGVQELVAPGNQPVDRGELSESDKKLQKQNLVLLSILNRMTANLPDIISKREKKAHQRLIDLAASMSF